MNVVNLLRASTSTLRSIPAAVGLVRAITARIPEILPEIIEEEEIISRSGGAVDL